jgi:hypothetical protein
VENNVVYLNSPEDINSSTERANESNVQSDLFQAIASQLESAMSNIKDSSNLQSQINELKLELNDLKNQIKLKDVLLEGKEAQLINKSKLNSKLKKEKSDLEHKLKFISQIIQSSKVIDSTQPETKDAKKYIIKNGVIETK